MGLLLHNQLRSTHCVMLDLELSTQRNVVVEDFIMFLYHTAKILANEELYFTHLLILACVLFMLKFCSSILCT